MDDVPGLQLVPDVDLRAVVLVEGASDRAAVETLAQRLGRDLHTEGTAVVPIGGAKSIARFLRLYGPSGMDVRVAGLCDEAEAGDYRRGLDRAGFGTRPNRAQMEAMGFFVCIADLEDELIRSLGTATVEEILDAEGDIASFRIFQKQPAQRDRTSAQQLHRFLGTRSGRKIHYGRVLVESLDLGRVPRPLESLLRHI